MSVPYGKTWPYTLGLGLSLSVLMGHAQTTLPTVTVVGDLPPGSSNWPGGLEVRIGDPYQGYQITYPINGSLSLKLYWAYTELYARYLQTGQYRNQPWARQSVIDAVNSVYQANYPGERILTLLNGFGAETHTQHDAWTADASWAGYYGSILENELYANALMDQGYLRGVDRVDNVLQSQFYYLISQQIVQDLPAVRVSAAVIDAPGTEFSGGFFTPLAAWYYWIRGHGQERRIDFSHIGIKPHCEDFPGLQTAINNHTDPGTYTIYTQKSYYTGRDSNIARVYLGTITLKLDGTFIRENEGDWRFSGKVSSYPDTYDANASTHRNARDEWSTRLLDVSGHLFGGEAYPIDITGGEDITCSG